MKLSLNSRSIGLLASILLCGYQPCYAITKADFRGVNVADLPGRCPVAELFPKGMDVVQEKEFFDTIASFKKKYPTVGVPELFLDIALAGNLRKTPFPLVFIIANEMNYYEHRDEIQKKFESKIRSQSDHLLKVAGLGNYLTALLYMGEFKKVIELFEFETKPPRGKSGDALVGPDVGQDATSLLAASLSYFRMGNFARAQACALKSHQLSPMLDSKWDLMLTEVGLYGNDFYKKHSKLYDTGKITKYFPRKGLKTFPFEDVTEKMGIDNWGGMGAVAFADMDGDGWDDLVWQRSFFPTQIYKNEKGKAFVPIPQSRLDFHECQSDFSAGPADVDNDGKPDLFHDCCDLRGPGPAELLKNVGDLTFQDITKKSGLSLDGRSGTISPWADFDLDGNIDLFVGDVGGRSRLYRGNGDGTFTDVTEKAGIKTPPATVSAAWGDFNGDRYPDLFVQGLGWKRLFMNNKDGTFRDATAASGLSGDGMLGFSAFAFDYDNDGLMDLFVGQYTTTDAEQLVGTVCTCSNMLRPEGFSESEAKAASTIYKNNGDGTFTNMRGALQFLPIGTMSQTYGDWNNDGNLDVVMGTGSPFFQQDEPYLFYQNNGDGTFANITPYTELRFWGKGHGMSFGDYDHDGNLDLALNNGSVASGDLEPSMLLHGRGNSNHWLEVGFKPGSGTNGSAIGAKVQLIVGKKKYTQELWSGNSFGGLNTFRLHFGLNKAKSVDKVTVFWPNKQLTTTELVSVAADQAIEVDQGTGQYRQLWQAPRP